MQESTICKICKLLFRLSSLPNVFYHLCVFAKFLFTIWYSQIFYIKELYPFSKTNQFNLTLISTYNRRNRRIYVVLDVDVVTETCKHPKRTKTATNSQQNHSKHDTTEKLLWTVCVTWCWVAWLGHVTHFILSDPSFLFGWDCVRIMQVFY